MADKGTIGLKNLVCWELLTDSEASPPTYGVAIPLAGTIEATVSPDTSEANDQYADDILYSSLSPDTPYKIELDIAGMSVANQAKLQGHALANDGGMVIRTGDEPPEFAFAWKSEIEGAGYLYVVIYKAKPEFMTRTYKTKEGVTVTRQTSKMTLKAVARIYDGHKQYLSEAMPAGFFTTPHSPVIADEITISVQPIDQYLAKSAGGSLTITAAVGVGVPDTYQWYKATSKSYATGVASAYTGNATAALTIPTNISDSTTHYFFCKLSNAGSADVYSEIVAVIVGA